MAEKRKILSIPSIPPRGLVVFGHDIVMAALSFLLALHLRLGDAFEFHSTQQLIHWTATFTVIAAAAFLLMGLYRGVWRYASLNDLLAITRSVTVAILVFAVVMFLWTRLDTFPRSALLINWFTLMALLGAPRFFYRLFKDRRIDLRLEDTRRPLIPVLLAGAGDEAELFIRSLSRPHDSNYQVVGIIGENTGRVGRRIHGVEVMGTVDDIPSLAAKLEKLGKKPQRLILTDHRMDAAAIRRLVDMAGSLGMTSARLPRLTDFRTRDLDVLEPRPIALEDLLGRPQTPLDREAMRRLIEGKRVLITGAGGSIGSELVRQASDFSPAELTLVENSEFNLYSIDMEMAGRHPGAMRRAVIADVRDRDHVMRLFDAMRPELVLHAAALKHVPLVEANPVEGATTNIIGSRNVADACIAFEVGTMVLISTDKAVNPTSIMGATKRIAEQYCQTLDLKRGDGQGTRFVTVRFGNVLGSTGSVVPLFRQQLAAGGPLTVTHPDMRRYFMTIHEAVELILQASAIGPDASQEGKIFVLDMGEPVRIVDLARQMIRLAGLEPDQDVKIVFTGLRPGEKLFEEIFHGSEPPIPTRHPGLLLAAPRIVEEATLVEEINAIAAACRLGDAASALEIIRRLVPEYCPEN